MLHRRSICLLAVSADDQIIPMSVSRWTLDVYAVLDQESTPSDIVFSDVRFTCDKFFSDLWSFA